MSDGSETREALHLAINGAPVAIDLGSVPREMHRWLSELLATGDAQPRFWMMHKAINAAALIPFFGTIQSTINEQRATAGAGPFAAMPELGRLPRHTDPLAVLTHYLLDALHAIVQSGTWDIALALGPDGAVVIQSVRWVPADVAAAATETRVAETRVAETRVAATGKEGEERAIAAPIGR